MGFSNCQVDITEKRAGIKDALVVLNITNREERLHKFSDFLTYWFIG